MDVNSDHILLDATLAKLRQLVPSPLNAPKVAIVCGSGLGTLASAITDRVDVPYAELPGFMLSLGMFFVLFSLYQIGRYILSSGRTSKHTSVWIYREYSSSSDAWEGAMTLHTDFFDYSHESYSFMRMKVTH